MSARSRALAGGFPSSLLLALPADALDQVVSIVYDAGEAFYVATTCSALRDSIARVRAEGRRAGRVERLTVIGTIFDTPTRTLWAALEASSETAPSILQSMFVVPEEQQSTHRVQALSDVRLTSKGVRVCAFSKVTDDEFIALNNLVQTREHWTADRSVLSIVCASGRVDMLKIYLTAKMPRGDGEENWPPMSAKLVEATRRLATHASLISHYPDLEHLMLEFRKECLAPAAKHGHHEIWAACIELLGQQHVLGGRSIVGWAEYLCDRAVWRSIASSGRLLAFVGMLTKSVTCREIWQKSSEPRDSHSRMRFVRYVELTAVRCIYESDGTDAAAWRWMINFVRKMGDTTINDAVGLRDWYVTSGRLKQLATGGCSSTGSTVQASRCTTSSSPSPRRLPCPCLLHNFGHVYEGSKSWPWRRARLSLPVRPVATAPASTGGLPQGHEPRRFLSRPVDARVPRGAAVRAAVALRGYSVSRLREVLKRTQDVLLADGPDADARRAAATLVQRVVTVPMMARAAMTGDVLTWEWCLSPVTAHGRALPEPAAFDRATLRLFARNGTLGGERRMIEFCLHKLSPEDVRADSDLCLHVLYCSRAVDLLVPHLRALRLKHSASRALATIAMRALDASPEAVAVCLGAGLSSGGDPRERGDQRAAQDRTERERPERVAVQRGLRRHPVQRGRRHGHKCAARLHFVHDAVRRPARPPGQERALRHRALRLGAPPVQPRRGDARGGRAQEGKRKGRRRTPRLGVGAPAIRVECQRPWARPGACGALGSVQGGVVDRVMGAGDWRGRAARRCAHTRGRHDRSRRGA